MLTHEQMLALSISKTIPKPANITQNKGENMRVYISGAITDQPDLNKPEFRRVEKLLRAMGHSPTNPHNLKHGKDATWRDYMTTDLKALLKCDAFVMLEGWDGSRGARIEKRLADDLGLVDMSRMIKEKIK